MGSQKSSTGGNNPQARPLSPFEFMDKYRVPILAVCAFALVGFGVWTAILGAVDPGPEGRKDPEEVMATFNVGDNEHSVTRQNLYEAYVGSNSDSSAVYGAKLSQLIRQAMVEDLSVSVSEEEVRRGLGSYKERLKSANDGKFDKDLYTKIINRKYHCQISEFESMFQNSMRLTKLMRQIDRVQDPETSMDEIFGVFKKQYVKIKLKGIFFSSESFEEEIKLPTDENDKLTAKGLETLTAWWKALEDKDRKAFHKGGALLTAQYMGFRFADRTDEELEAAFKAVNADSGTSLEKLTSDFTPADEDKAKFVFRFDRHRTLYGLDDESDVDAEYAKREGRLTIEWKIWKLVKKLHDQVSKDLADKKAVDIAVLAKANNLSVHHFTKEALEDLRTHEEVGGNWALQLPRTKKGQVLKWATPVGPQSPSFATGPVDEVGKYVGIWMLNDIVTDPEPKLSDVLAEARESYLTKRADELRDAAFDVFEKKYDAILDKKVAAFAKTANEEAEAAIKEETADLDLLNDKDEVERIKKAKMDEAEARIKEEKGKYRSDAFDTVLADAGPHATVVEEGFFSPSAAQVETGPADDKKGMVERRARHAIRREFRSELHDNHYSKTFIDVGTVSKPLVCQSQTTLKGMAKLVGKKYPIVQDMLLHPRNLGTAEDAAWQAKNKPATSSLWDLAALKSGSFGIKAEKIDKKIAEDEARVRERTQKLAERKRRIDARNAEKAKAAKEAQVKALEAARKAALENNKKALEAGKPNEVIDVPPPVKKQAPTKKSEKKSEK